MKRDTTTPTPVLRPIMCALSMLALVAAGCDDKGGAAVAGGASGRAIIPDENPNVPPPIGPNGANGSGGSNGSGRGTERQGAPEDGERPVAERSASAFAVELASLHRTWAAEEAALAAEFPKRLEEIVGSLGGLAPHVKRAYTVDGVLRGQPFMSRAGQLTAEADQILQTLITVGDHGLDPARYHAERMQAALHKLGDHAVGRGTPNKSADEAALWKLLEDTRAPSGEPSLEQLKEAASKAGFSDADTPRLATTRAHLDAALARQKTLADALVELDALIVHGVVRWVYDQRFARKAHPFLADKTEADGFKRTANDLELFFGQVDWTRAETVVTAMNAAVPRFPDYEATRQAFLRYRAYAEKYPEHIELPKEVEKLGKGKKGDAVTKLEERLIQEEYLAGPATGTFGDALTEAINLYQDTHQMKATGKVDKATRASMNKSFADRAEQLKLSLMRYRESDLHQSAHRFGEIGRASDKNGSPTSAVRAVVNIPAMEARFYIGTELARTHRVVVGNNDNDSDATTGKKGKLNQTRLLTAEMQTIVLNPVWNVPRRIKEQELDVLLMDEPDYYEKHNFKILMNPDGSERVVQQPGPGNALGLVKFLFPNQFAIYMHDTPKKKLFERPVRAFSHGCMRTENPLDLARWILVDVDKEMTNEQFDEILASREERHFAVNPRIPISTDYVTTTIDAEGRVHFLADIYGFDRDYFEGKVPHRADRDFPMTVVF